MPNALDVALIDIGGTLWPNSWPFRKSDGLGRHQRVTTAMPMLDADAVNALVADLIESSRHGDQARAVGMNHSAGAFGTAEVLVAECLARQGLPADPQTVSRIRRAMAIPVADRMKPLPGAIELLAEIRALGLRTVITSNTYWRDADSYWEDFRMLGMAEYIEAVVTSVDAGHLKPHPAVFEMAMRVAKTPAERCVVIGNREENDIEPALALGMWTILVYPDDPKPASSRAHVVAPDLWECAKAVKTMLAR
ncbi:MAG TPA: HAD family hydrolase [Candidatus Dormibacteraeota bacterium]|nr:HAD family hydrolase [Candidatus Dormibacteraeota bacterium]